MTTKNDRIAKALIIGGITVVVLAIAIMVLGNVISEPSSMSTARKDGIRAAAAGVPAQANPYERTRHRRQWLDGWIEETQWRAKR